jgi:hypothetical protein
MNDKLKRTPWYRPDQVPARKGWYERDHRQCWRYYNPEERCISLDLWEPSNHPVLAPGVWYVKNSEPSTYYNHILGRYVRSDGINDASEQHLPWRGVAK